MRGNLPDSFTESHSHELVIFILHIPHSHKNLPAFVLFLFLWKASWLLSLLLLSVSFFHYHTLETPVSRFEESVYLTATIAMGFGIKESKATQGNHVPGTATLLDMVVSSDTEQQESSPSSVKRITKKNGDVIILVPQPSNSPNDPLVSAGSP